MNIREEKGSAVLDVTIAAAMIVFVLLPIFSATVEKFVLFEKARMIKDAVDMTNISVYNALVANNLGKVNVDISYSEASKIFEELLCINLSLEEGLIPKTDSIAEARVEIRSLYMYMGPFPVECPDGMRIEKPSVHSRIIVPVRPSLYRNIVLGMLGKDYIDMEVHVDSEIPVNN